MHTWGGGWVVQGRRRRATPGHSGGSAACNVLVLELRHRRPSNIVNMKIHDSAAIVTRIAWVAILVLAAVFVGYASVHGTILDDSPYGGLAACFACNNGWNWHFLLFTLAFPVFMLESLLTFRAPIFPQR